MKPALYKRIATITVANIESTYDEEGNGLRMAFKIIKNPWSKSPNRAELKIFNLSDEKRGQLDALVAKKIRIPVTVDAGYWEGFTLGTIFKGHLRSIAHSRETGDVITKIIASSYATIDVPVRGTYKGPNTSVGTIAADLLKQVQKKIADVDVSSAIAAALTGDLSKITAQFNRAVTIEDTAMNALDKLTIDHGYQFSEQDGRITLLSRKGYLIPRAVVLNAATGLIGGIDPVSDVRRPEVTLIRARSLLNPHIEIGVAIQLDSKFNKGLFVVEHLEHNGDTHGGSSAYVTLFTGRGTKEAASIAAPGETDIAVRTGVLA